MSHEEFMKEMKRQLVLMCHSTAYICSVARLIQDGKTKHIASKAVYVVILDRNLNKHYVY
jgi:hypothetical protein